MPSSDMQAYTDRVYWYGWGDVPEGVCDSMMRCVHACGGTES